MDKFLQEHKGILQWCTRVLDLIVLNFIFLICSIPIVTIGASVTALYFVTLKMVRNEESYLVKSFLKSFKRNFKQATFIWLGFLLIGGIVALDYYFFTITGGVVFTVLKAVLVVFTVYLIAIALYVFPILSRFVFTTKEVLRHGIYMCFHHFVQTLLLLIMLFPILFLTFYSIYTGLFMLLLGCIFGFALYAYMQSFIFRGIFDQYQKDRSI